MHEPQPPVQSEASRKDATRLTAKQLGLFSGCCFLVISSFVICGLIWALGLSNSSDIRKYNYKQWVLVWNTNGSELFVNRSTELGPLTARLVFPSRSYEWPLQLDTSGWERWPLEETSDIPRVAKPAVYRAQSSSVQPGYDAWAADDLSFELSIYQGGLRTMRLSGSWAFRGTITKTCWSDSGKWGSSSSCGCGAFLYDPQPNVNAAGGPCYYWGLMTDACLTVDSNGRFAGPCALTSNSVAAQDYLVRRNAAWRRTNAPPTVNDTIGFTVTIRSMEDPWVKAANLTDNKMSFGPSPESFIVTGSVLLVFAAVFILCCSTIVMRNLKGKRWCCCCCSCTSTGCCLACGEDSIARYSDRKPLEGQASFFPSTGGMVPQEHMMMLMTGSGVGGGGGPYLGPVLVPVTSEAHAQMASPMHTPVHFVNPLGAANASNISSAAAPPGVMHPHQPQMQWTPGPAASGPASSGSPWVSEPVKVQPQSLAPAAAVEASAPVAVEDNDTRKTV